MATSVAHSSGGVAALAASVPIAELARLGRTLRAWQPELTAHFDHPIVANGPTENLNLKSRTPRGPPADTATSTTTGCGCCSTPAASAKITHRHESEPALPGSLRGRAWYLPRPQPSAPALHATGSPNRIRR